MSENKEEKKIEKEEVLNEVSGGVIVSPKNPYWEGGMVDESFSSGDLSAEILKELFGNDDSKK